MGKNSSYNFTSGETIVYRRDSDNEFWERRRSAELKSVMGNTLISYQKLPTISKTIELFKEISNAERAKEEAFMKSLPAYKDVPYEDFVQHFNEVLQGAERFKALKERIDDAVNRVKKDKSQFKGMAPNMSSLFGSYFQIALEEGLEKFVNTVDINKPLEQWSQQYYDCIDAALKNALIKMDSASEYEKIFGTITDQKSIYGGAQAWGHELTQILTDMQIPQARSFANMIFEKVGGAEKQNFQQLQKDLQQQMKSVKNNVRDNIKAGSQTAQIGGFVSEHALAIVVSMIQNAINGSGVGKFYADAVSTDKTLTDSIYVWSGKTTLDSGITADEIYNRVNNFFADKETTFENVSQKFNSFYEKELGNLDDSFIMFVNAKNYGLGNGKKSSTDISKTKEGPLETLPSFLEETEIILGDPEEFLQMAYNTAEGAITNQFRSQIEANTVNALKTAAAKLLFDDYSEIGAGLEKPGANILHVYQLDEMFIPSSVIFGAMGTALKDASTQVSTRVKARVTLPGPVLDDYPDEGSDEYVKAGIIEASHREWANAMSSSSWAVTFTLNIRQTLMEYLHL